MLLSLQGQAFTAAGIGSRRTSSCILGFLSLFGLASASGYAQTPACIGGTLTGTVHDPTDAIIPQAQVRLDDGAPVSTNSAGQYNLACVAPGSHQVHVMADGFAAATIQVVLPHQGTLDVTLPLQAVETSISVNDGGEQLPSDAAASSPAAHTLAGSDLATLADDPDDLTRELQQLAATAGANPASTLITIDGFQNESTLPPKSSIAYIKVNPDLYSAEYREPPFEGGRMEVYTKPGQPTLHGALFTTNGSSWMNARNPFSVTEGTLGKQRYGAELSGPVRRQGSDFAVSLEHRQINNTAVVKAVTLDASGNPRSVVDSIPIPQTLWLATARNGWQLGAKNTFVAEYSANANHLLDQGVGGTALANGTGLFLVGQAGGGLQSIIEGSTVSDNENSSDGSESPGMTVINGGSVLIIDNIVSGNTSHIAYGSGISLAGNTSAYVIQNLVINNTEDARVPSFTTDAIGDEGGINLNVSPESTTFLTNNTVAYNQFINDPGRQPVQGTQLVVGNFGELIASNNLFIGMDSLAPV